MEVKFDRIDRKILKEFDRNSRRSNNQIARAAGISRERLEYRIKRLFERKIINKFPTIINPTKFGYSMHKLYFQFQNLSLKKEEELIGWLVKNEYVQWVTTCKGKWDMNIIVFAHNAEHFESIMQPFYNKYAKYILSKSFNISLAVGNMEKGWILKETSKNADVIYTANEREDAKIDETDLEILKLLGNNSRIPLIEVAEKIGQSTRVVQHRIKVLEKKEVIKGYTVSLNYNVLKKQFYKVVFFINIIDEDLKKKLIEYCVARFDMPYFVFCVGEWPFEVEYVVDDVDQYYEALEEIRERFPQIKRYESILLSKEHKFDFMPFCYRPLNGKVQKS